MNTPLFVIWSALAADGTASGVEIVHGVAPTLYFMAGMAISETEVDTTWVRKGRGRSNEYTLGMNLLPELRTGTLYTTLYAEVGFYNSYLSLSEQSDFLAVSEGAYVEVTDASDIRLISRGPFAGITAKLLHTKFGFLDVGAGMRLAGNADLHFYSNDATRGNECKMDVDDAIGLGNPSSPLYWTVRYGLHADIKEGDAVGGLFVGASLLGYQQPEMNPSSLYHIYSADTSEPALVPTGNQPVRSVQLLLGFSL